MAALIRPLVADKGATFSLSLRIKDPAGDPVDLTGHSTRLVRVAKSEAAEQLSTHAGTVDNQGWVRVTVAKELTAVWIRSSYRLELTKPNGDVDFLLVGSLAPRSCSTATAPRWPTPRAAST